MVRVGTKQEVFGSNLQPRFRVQTDLSGKPTKMPELNASERLLCGMFDGLVEVIYICLSLDDMQKLYSQYLEGYAIEINWYKYSG